MRAVVEGLFEESRAWRDGHWLYDAEHATRQAMIEKGIKWTQIRSLVHRWLTDHDREKLVDYIEKKRPTTRQFKEKVQAKVKAKKRNVRRRGR